MTQIETGLFLDGRAHCLIAFDLSKDAITLTLHPWERPSPSVHACFSNPNVLSIDDSYADGDRELPWDIIGFDSSKLADGRWRFCLHTDCVEYVFEANWPEIKKPT